MPRIPIYYGDHWESIYGVMLYPHNSEMARHHVAVNHLSVALAEMDLGNMRRVRKETPKRKKAGELIGGVVKALTVLIRADGAADHPPPSWAAAIKHAQKFYWTGARRSYRKPPNCNTSKVKEDLSKFASVLHLWGAQAEYFQDGLGLHRPDRPHSEEEAAMFMCKAMAIHEFLIDWNSRRAVSKQSQYLSADAVTPWDVSQLYATAAWPLHAGEAHIGDRLRPDLLVEADGVPVVRPRGWPKGRRRSAQ